MTSINHPTEEQHYTASKIVAEFHLREVQKIAKKTYKHMCKFLEMTPDDDGDKFSDYLENMFDKDVVVLFAKSVEHPEGTCLIIAKGAATLTNAYRAGKGGKLSFQACWFTDSDEALRTAYEFGDLDPRPAVHIPLAATRQLRAPAS